MGDNRHNSVIDAKTKIKECVCIDTDRVYDSCADKDCLADLRVTFPSRYQCILDRATSIRCRGCEIINCFVDVESVPFNRGCYTVDITFFFKVFLDAFTTPAAPPELIAGLCTFSKRCILYGSEGNVKVFSSEFSRDGNDEQFPPECTNLKAKVQAVDPICLDAKLCKERDCCERCCDCSRLPRCVLGAFGGEFDRGEGENAVLVTLGLFTIVQLQREVQILIPAYNFCVPTKECSADTDDPCDSFKKIRFPVDEFFPPDECGLDTSPTACGSCGCGK